MDKGQTSKNGTEVCGTGSTNTTTMSITTTTMSTTTATTMSTTTTTTMSTTILELLLSRGSEMLAVSFNFLEINWFLV